MSESSLRDDLLSIPGVEGAEIEGSAEKPAGLRIRIAEGADQRAVGGAIRRVLTSHGLGTDTRLPGEPDGGAPQGIAAVPDSLADESGDRDAAPMLEEAATAVAVADEATEADRAASDDSASDESASDVPGVIDLTDGRLDDVAEDVGVPEEADAGAAEPESGEPEAVEPEAVEPEARDLEPVEPEPVERQPVEPEVTAPEPAEPDLGVPRLASVSVEEGRDGIVITVATTSGERVRQPAASTEGGVESAVVRATARLALPEAPDATVVDIEDRRVEGADIVMIVLDVDGRLHAGSAVVAAGRAFALGRATWAALTL